MTDFRALCAELLFCLDDLYPLADGEGWPVSKAWAAMERTRAALTETQSPADGEVQELIVSEIARNLRTKAATEKANACHYSATLLTRAADLLECLPDGPAVQSREPASVVEQPSDGNCWQWYTYCPEEGLEIYTDREQAQSAAQSIMGSYEVAAYSDGWHEDMESVSWGILVPVEQAEVVERKTAESNDEFDEWVKYELRPARYNTVTPRPTPVTERLPEAGDCDAEGRCWGFHPYNPEDDDIWNSWSLVPAKLLPSSPFWIGWDYWLPAHALPLPSGEVR
jgi:hypothetical protein